MEKVEPLFRNSTVITTLKVIMCLFLIGLIKRMFGANQILSSNETIAFKVGVIVSYLTQLFGAIHVLHHLFQKKPIVR